MSDQILVIIFHHYRAPLWPLQSRVNQWGADAELRCGETSSGNGLIGGLVLYSWNGTPISKAIEQSRKALKQVQQVVSFLSNHSDAVHVAVMPYEAEDTEDMEEVSLAGLPHRIQELLQGSDSTLLLVRQNHIAAST